MTSRQMRVSGEIASRIPTSSGSGSKDALLVTLQDPVKITPPVLNKDTTCMWRLAGLELRVM